MKPTTRQTDHRYSILIVEDDLEVSSVLQSLVEHSGYRPIVATGAQQAREAFRVHNPLCVLLDLGLPDVRAGVDLLGQLRREFGRDAVIIVVTGHTAKEVHEEVWVAGADHLITKPMRAELLMRILESDRPAPEGDARQSERGLHDSVVRERLS